MVELTENHRQILLLVIIILALIGLFSSFMLFICAAYIKIKVDARIKLIETYNSNVLPGIFVFVGIINLVQNVICIFVCARLRTVANRENSMRLLLPILIGGAVLVAFEVSSAIASFVHISILNGEFEAGLKKGMAEYVKGGELKVEMDTVQTQYSCCGDQDYTNWFTNSWVDPQYLRSSRGGTKKYFSSDGKYYSDDTPFSCCDMRSPRPCIHHHIHDNTRHHNYDYKVETTLHVQGCREVLMDMYSSILWSIGWVALLIALIKTVVLLLLRLIQTSLILAEEENNWEATTQAYIYYLKPEDADLKEKEKEDKSNNKIQRKSRKRRNNSDTENDTDDTENTNTESDDETDKSGTESDVNKNYDTEDSDDTVNVKERESDNIDKPKWPSIFFPPPYQNLNYFPEQIVDRSDVSNDYNRAGDEKRLFGFYNEGFTTENGQQIGNNFYNVNENKYSVEKGGFGTRENPNAFKEIVERVPSSHNVSSSAGRERDIKSFAANDILAWLKKTMTSSKGSENRFSLSPSDSRCLPKESKKNNKSGVNFRGKKRQMKFRTSTDIYKYALINSSSNSEDDNDDDDDEEEEEVEEEMETDEKKGTGKGSSEESDHYCKDKNKTDNSDQKQHSDLFMNECQNSVLMNKTIMDNHDCKQMNINLSQFGQRNLNNTDDNQLEFNLTRLTGTHDEQQKYVKNQSIDENVYSDRSIVYDCKSSVETTEDIGRYPGPHMPCYHEVDERTIKKNIKANTLKWSKNGKLSNNKEVSVSNADSKNNTENLGQSEDTSSSDFTSSYDLTMQQDKYVTFSHNGLNEMNLSHKRVAELRRKCDSSETESDTTALDSGSGSVHVRRFGGRSTPFPYNVVRHEATLIDQDCDLIPTNIRRGQESNSVDSVCKPQSKTDDNKFEPMGMRLDIPESDTEVSILTHSARVNETLSLVSKNKMEDNNRNQKAHNDKELFQHQKSVEAIAALSSSSLGFQGYSEPSSFQSDPSFPDKNQRNPCAKAMYRETKPEFSSMSKSAGNSFSFPLMLPSPSPLEVSGSMRNHIRSYQRHSIFLSSSISPSSTVSPINSTSPHLALFNSPFIDTPIETSTPINSVNTTSDLVKCPVLVKQAFQVPLLTNNNLGTKEVPLLTSINTGTKQMPLIPPSKNEMEQVPLLTSINTGTKQMPLIPPNKNEMEQVPLLTSINTGTKQMPLIPPSKNEMEQVPLLTSINTGTKQMPLIPPSKNEMEQVPLLPNSNEIRTIKAPLLTPINIRAHQMPLKTQDNNGTKHVPLLTPSIVEEKQKSLLTSLNVGTKQFQLLATNNVETKQRLMLTPVNVGTKQAQLLAPNNVETKQRPNLTPLNVVSKQALYLATNNVETKQRPVLTPFNVEAKQTQLLAPSNAVPKQAQSLTPCSVETKYESMLTPFNVGTKHVQLLAPNNVGTKQTPVPTLCNTEAKQMSSLTTNKECVKQTSLTTSNNSEITLAALPNVSESSPVPVGFMHSQSLVNAKNQMAGQKGMVFSNSTQSCQRNANTESAPNGTGLEQSQTSNRVLISPFN